MKGRRSYETVLWGMIEIGKKATGLYQPKISNFRSEERVSEKEVYFYNRFSLQHIVLGIPKYTF